MNFYLKELLLLEDKHESELTSEDLELIRIYAIELEVKQLEELQLKLIQLSNEITE